MVGGVEGRGRWVWGKALSIILRAAYAIGVLVYVAFYTEGFSLFQEVVVLLVAIIVYGRQSLSYVSPAVLEATGGCSIICREMYGRFQLIESPEKSTCFGNRASRISPRDPTAGRADHVPLVRSDSYRKSKMCRRRNEDGRESTQSSPTAEVTY